MISFSQGRARAARGGSVIILTLWSLFFLGALALAAGAHVSANLRLAAEMRGRTTARYLARAGVELARHEISRNATNWLGVADGDMASDEELFRDVGLGAGTFSVLYTYVATNTGLTVTNYGVRCEARQVNLNRILSPDVQKALADLIVEQGGETSASAERIAEAVKDHWVQKKDKMLTEGVKVSYKGVFQSLYELLLVEALKARAGLFRKLEPHLTLYDADCFSGRAVGRAEGSGAECRIDFVCDRKGTLLYWHER